jgi:hypothetical protein
MPKRYLRLKKKLKFGDKKRNGLSETGAFEFFFDFFNFLA